MAKNILEEFIETLKKVPWMDKDTRAKAIEKANAIDFNIAYPNEMMDDQKLNEYYRELELHPKLLLNSVLRVRTFQNNQKIRDFRQPILREDWREFAIRAANVDAFYHTAANSISKLNLFQNLVHSFVTPLSSPLVSSNRSWNSTKSSV